MKLISLDIANFRIIKRAKLEFRDSVIGIIGRNGAGKSSIIEAIAWAIYGNQAARTGKDQIKATFATEKEICKVELEFEHTGQIFKVIRKLVGRTDRAEVELFRNGKPESIGVVETKDHVGQLLGMDWRAFLTSFLARQQELNALSDLAPAKRKEHLAGMLGVNRLDKAIIKLKEDTKLLSSRSKILQEELLGKTDWLDRLDKAKNELETANLNKIEITKTVLKAEKVFQKSNEELEKMRQSRHEKARLTAELKALENKFIGNKQRLAALNQELENLRTLQTTLIKLENELKQFNAITAEYEKMKQAQASEAHKQSLLKQVVDTQQEIEQNQKLLKTTELSANSISLEIKALPADLLKQIDSHEKQLEETRQSYMSVRSQRDIAAGELEKLTKQMAGIDDLGPDTVCDRCLRPFGEHYNSIQAHLKAESAQFTKQLKKNEHELGLLKIQGEDKKKQLDALQLLSSKQAELSLRFKQEEVNLSELRARIKSANSKLEEQKTKLAELPEQKFDSKAMDQQRLKVEQLNKSKSEFDQISGQVIRIPKLIKEVDHISKEIETGQAEISSKSTEISKLGFDETIFEKLTQTTEQARADHENAREQLIAATSVIELANKEIEITNSRLKELAEREKQLETILGDHYYLEKLVLLFGDFRTSLISQIRPTLSELSSELISEMTDGRYNMVELDEKYNLRIWDYGQYYEVERFSGGEKDLANLCLRLAISQMITRSAGLDQAFIILDEVFGSQDVDRRNLIISALGGLRKRFPQIILITHIDEIKDLVEDRIEVEQTEEPWSRVLYNGVEV